MEHEHDAADVLLDVVIDEKSTLAREQSVSWAARQVRAAQGGAAGRTITILVTDPARAELDEDLGGVRDAPEAFALFWRDGDTVVLTGDARGVVYGLLEIEDTLRTGADALTGPALRRRLETPANRVRGIMRLFTSEAEDSPWFRDRGFWVDYLDELARHRFNRFTFTVGAGYDYLIDRRVDDAYFCFFYPFVLDVPGYGVRVDGLDEAERRENLELLKFIAAETVRRGLDFRLGMWNHAYDYGTGRDDERHRILGLDASTHAEYSRDALVRLLQEVPEISGLTLRVHFEGGVPEPTHEFWRRVLERLDEVDTLTELDFHAKGVDDELVRTVERLGKRLVLSPKYWAEHMGPPYHQASIRAREAASSASPDGDAAEGAPSTGHHDATVGGTSVTSRRSFTRYGYGDFLARHRPYDLLYRVWPGTQRVLLWGDPAMAAGIGREAGFGGSTGVEWFEPLSFKGKKGSGRPGGREVYRDGDLALGVDDWKKHSYTYRLWGRFAYDPDTDPEVWQRALRARFGAGAAEAGEALAQATRILPYLLLTHAPSVANNVYWPEMLTPEPLIRDDEPIANPYAASGWPANADFDMTEPYRFSTVSALDPQLFATVEEYADAVCSGVGTAKTSPLESADRFERLARGALRSLEAAEIDDARSPEWRRWSADVRIMAGIGLFTADKLRAAVALALFERGNAPAGAEAVELYDRAIAAWLTMLDAASVYRDDLTFGQTDYSRGHWSDRLPAIREDRDRVAAAVAAGGGAGTLSLAGLHRPGAAPSLAVDVPSRAVSGAPLPIGVEAEDVDEVVVWHRATDQSQTWRSTATTREGSRFSTTLPGSATSGEYDLQLMFEATRGGERWMLPRLDDDLSNRPYLVVSIEDRPGTADGEEPR